MINENKTQQFKKHVQMIVMEITGQKVSQDKAWQLFKALQAGTVEFVANIEPENNVKTLSLAGVGKFQIKETEPTGKKAGLVKKVDAEGNPVLDEEGKPIFEEDANLPKWKVVPRYKFTPSAAINQYLYAIYNCPGAKQELVKNTGIFKADDQTVECNLNEVEPEEVAEEIVVIKDDVDFF